MQRGAGTSIYVSCECGTKTLILIKAPCPESDEVWKAQDFDYARDRLRPILKYSITANMVIVFFSKHFPMLTVTA